MMVCMKKSMMTCLIHVILKWMKIYIQVFYPYTFDTKHPKLFVYPQWFLKSVNYLSKQAWAAIAPSLGCDSSAGMF